MDVAKAIITGNSSPYRKYKLHSSLLQHHARNERRMIDERRGVTPSFCLPSSEC